jgi:hypothetical protein
MDFDVDSEDDASDDDDDNDSVVVAGVIEVVRVSVVVVGSAAKAGSKKAELLQHTKKSCKARSAVAHAGAIFIFIPDQKGVVSWAWLLCEELSSCSSDGLFFASSLVDDRAGR